jgi:hypothetical protein
LACCGVSYKALLKHLFPDNMEVDDAVPFDAAKLCAQYRVERLFNHYLHQLYNGMPARNAVMRLMQARGTAS